jgi:uncharacterized protein (TIGR02302 family)
LSLPPSESKTARQQAAVDASAVLQRALGRAWWAILWERLWPALAAIATVAGLFLAVSWLGLWLWLPPLGRAFGLFAFAVLAAGATMPLLLVRFPSHHDRLRRLDLTSHMAHRPATAIGDEMAGAGEDLWSKTLWRVHVERALLLARSLKAGMPAPRLMTRDPMALRALVLLLAVSTFFAAGGERIRRVAAAFDWQGAVAAPNFRLDAWVSPPTYTGKPPVILPGLHPGEPAQSTAAVSVPVGSVLIVRTSGRANVQVHVTGGLAAAPDQAAAAGTTPGATGTPASKAPTGTEEHRFTISASGTAVLRGTGGDDLTWGFNAIPDRAPAIALTKDPEPQARGALLLSYKVEDDYGVVDAKAALALKPAAEPRRPLFAAPEFPLVLPQARTRNGVGSTMKDLTEHPWAGADVSMTLTARDEAGNEGRSETTELRLPERAFAKPVARALVDQRRELALDADARDRVLVALDALTIAPERFTPEAAVFLGLRALYWRLAQAKSDDDLREVVQRMWAMATQLEDGDVSETEARLRQAQEALRQALERGAGDEEIKKLMDELRAALDKFMQALAEEMRKNPQNARPLDRNAARQLRSQDLKNMLDRLEQMARSGAKDAAKQMLEQLQQMLENLQTARPGQSGDDDDMMSSLDELGDMIRKQQQLRDKTFRQGQDQRRGQRGQKGQKGQPGQDQDAQDGQDGEQNFGQLQQDQRALRDQLKKLMEELKRKGFDQNQDGQQGQQGDDPLGKAGEAMGDAEGRLGDNNADGAVDSQGKALDALRKGAQGMAQQLQQQMGQGPGPGQPGGRTGPARADQDTDPLGRPLRGRNLGDDTTVKVPGEIDVQRARRILEELRKRYGESFRPQMELDYLERLLKDY